MQRIGNVPSVGWPMASILFHPAAGLGWRLHMSRIASEIGTVIASSHAANNRHHIDDLTDAPIWARPVRPNPRDHEIKVAEAPA